MKKIIVIIIFGLQFSGCKTKQAVEYYNLGEENYMLDNYKKSYKYFSKAVKLDKSKPEYFIKRAEAAARWKWRANGLSMVERAYNDLFDLYPWNEDGLLSIANYHYRYRYSFVSTLRNLDSLINRYPKNIEAYMLRGEVYFDKKDTLSGYKDFRKAIVLSQNSKEIYDRIGIIENQNKYYNNSIVSFRQAFKLNKQPILSSCHYLSKSFLETNQKDSACYYFSMVNDKKKILQSSTYKQIREYCANK